MKNKVIAFAFFVLGILLFYLNKDTSQLLTNTDNQVKINFYDSMNAFVNYKFLGIFINNLIVGILLSFIGYFTGGLLTLLILVWNGFLVAIIYNIGFHQLPLNTILYASKHAPFEIYAFILFAEYGLEGRFFIKKILINNEIDFTLIPKYQNLYFPIVLLLIASILETL